MASSAPMCPGARPFLTRAGVVHAPPRLAKERGDVDLVVGNLQRRTLAIVDARAPIAGTAADLVARRARACAPVVEAGGDDGHADLLALGLVEHSPKDDVGVGVRRALDDLGRLVDLEQPEVAPTRDVEQDPGRALDVLLEQRAGDRVARGLRGAVLT